MDLALQCSPDHPWVDRAPGVVHDAGRRHDRLRREPAEEVPGHLPAELRQRPRAGIYGRGASRRCRSGSTTASRSFRVDNPHTKPVAVLAVDASPTSAQDAPRGHLARPRPSRSPAMMHTLAKDRLPAERTRTTRGATPSPRAARSTSQELAGRVRARLHAALASGRRRTTSCTPYMQFGGPAGLEGAQRPRSRPSAPRPTASTPVTSSMEHVAAPRRRGADRQREVRVQGPRLGRLRARRPEGLGRSLAGWLGRCSTRSRRAHPALHRLRNIDRSTTTDDDELPLPSPSGASSTTSTRPPDARTPSWSSPTSTRTRRARGTPAPRHAARSASRRPARNPTQFDRPRRPL